MQHIHRCAPVFWKWAWLFSLGLILFCLPKHAMAIPISPAPSQTPLAPTLEYNSTSNPPTVGDPDVALGRKYAIVKANNQIHYIVRNIDGSLGTPSTPLADGTFWGTTAMDATNNGNAVTITGLRGDGQVSYDPWRSRVPA